MNILTAFVIFFHSVTPPEQPNYDLQSQISIAQNFNELNASLCEGGIAEYKQMIATTLFPSTRAMAIGYARKAIRSQAGEALGDLCFIGRVDAKKELNDFISTLQ